MATTALRAWPSELLRQERRTAPRFLPLWAISLVALAGHQPGSTAWGLAAVSALLLGVLVAPLVGSIAPTVPAYLSLLGLVLAMSIFSMNLPLGVWYDRAWLDPGSTGLLAMLLVGGVVVGGFTSLLWAALVAIEVGRRAVRRYRTGSADPPAGTSGHVPPVPVSVMPQAKLRARRWPQRLYVAAVCVALAVPLPSFFVMSGVFIRPLAGPHAGIGGFISDAVTALTWPTITTLWLAIGAVLGWLVHTQKALESRVALALVASLGVLVVVVLISAATFGIEPGASAQGFAPTVVDYCPGLATGCSPEWLFSAPRLARYTGVATAPGAWAMAGATAAVVVVAWRRGLFAGTGASPRA